MIPKHCSIINNKRNCLNVPSYIVSVKVDNEDYMIGVVCSIHKDIMEKLLKVKYVSVDFEPLHYIATKCALESMNKV
ncbi:MAG: hypothetical protein QXK74_00830 [Candidatus Nitrosocaldaceae archaeon]